MIELQHFWICCVFPDPLQFLCVPSPSLRSASGLTSACPSSKVVDNGGFDCGQSRIRHVLIHQPSLCFSVGSEILHDHSDVGGWNKQLVVTVVTSWPLTVQGCLGAFCHRSCCILLAVCRVQNFTGQVGRLELAVWFCELCFLKLCFRLGNNCLSLLVTKITFQLWTSSLKGSNSVLQPQVWKRGGLIWGERSGHREGGSNYISIS